MKRGIQTTEFWVALSGIGALLYQEVAARCNFDYPFLLSLGGIVISYIVGRSWVKARQGKQPDL